MTKIRGWFMQENRDTLAALIVQCQIRTVLEIGTCFGLSAGWFAQRVERVTCVDTWGEIPCAAVPANVYDIFLANMAAGCVAEKVTAIRGDSHDPAICRCVPAADLVYVDGDHTYEGCKRDIEMYSPKARKILCGDDYGTDNPELAGVTRAIDEMLPGANHNGRFWWIDK